MYLKVLFLITSLFTVSLAQKYQITVFDAWSIDRISGSKIIYSNSEYLTDENGECRFVSTSKDSFINVKANGYFAAKVNIINRKDIAIYLQPVESSSAIIVLQQNSNTLPLFLPAGTSIITISKMERATSTTIDQIIGMQTGLTNKSYGGEGQINAIALRGMAAEQTQVLFDGIPMNSLQLGGVDFSSQNINQIGAVEIYRGSSPIFGGTGAIAGTINLKPPNLSELFEVELRHQISSLENYNSSININLPYQGLQQYFSLDFTNSKNIYTTSTDGQKVDLENRDFKSENIFWQAAYPFTDKLKANILVTNFKQKGGASKPFSGPNAENGNIARKTNDNTLTRIRVDQSLENGTVEYQLYQRNEWNGYSDPKLNVNGLHFNKESGAFIRLRYLLSPFFLLHGGIEAARQKIRSSDAGTHSRNRLAAYLFGDWLIYEMKGPAFNVHLNFSGRSENTSRERIFLPGFGINANYEYISVFASFGKNHRIPGFNDLYWSRLGNPSLKAETSTNYEAGFSLKKEIAGLATNISTNIFKTKIQDQIKWLADGNEWRPDNIAEVISEGIEISASVQPISKKYFLSFNYSFTDIIKTKTEFAGDKTIGNRLPYIPVHSFSSTVKYFWNDFEFGTNLNSMSFRYKTLANEANHFLPAQTLISAWTTFSMDIYKKLKGTIWLFADNLSDQNYQMIAGYPMPPRTYRLTLSINY